MAINYKTFPLAAYPEIITIWEQAREAIESNVEETLYLPVGTKKETHNMRFLMQRVRAAVRHQMDNGTQYDFLILRLCKDTNKGGDSWYIKIEDRAAGILKNPLVLHNKDGEPI